MDIQNEKFTLRQKCEKHLFLFQWIKRKSFEIFISGNIKL